VKVMIDERANNPPPGADPVQTWHSVGFPGTPW